MPQLNKLSKKPIGSEGCGHTVGELFVSLHISRNAKKGSRKADSIVIDPLQIEGRIEGSHFRSYDAEEMVRQYDRYGGDGCTLMHYETA